MGACAGRWAAQARPLCRCLAKQGLLGRQAAAASTAPGPAEPEERPRPSARELPAVGLAVLCGALGCALAGRRHLPALLACALALGAASRLLRRRAGLGGAQRHASKGGERGSGEVVLHVYHFGQSAGVRALNGALLQFGVGGAFHTGVEVHGREWAFGFKDGSGSGVFCTEPGGHADHSHWFALAQGATPLSESEVDALVQRLSKEWVASGFDSFSRNCADFCEELCLGLGVCGPPAWVGRGPRLAGSVLAALAGEGDGEPQAQAGLEREGEALARACLD